MYCTAAENTTTTTTATNEKNREKNTAAPDDLPPLLCLRNMWNKLIRAPQLLEGVSVPGVGTVLRVEKEV